MDRNNSLLEEFCNHKLDDLARSYGYKDAESMSLSKNIQHLDIYLAEFDNLIENFKGAHDLKGKYSWSVLYLNHVEHCIFGSSGLCEENLYVPFGIVNKIVTIEECNEERKNKDFFCTNTGNYFGIDLDHLSDDMDKIIGDKSIVIEFSLEPLDLHTGETIRDPKVLKVLLDNEDYTSFFPDLKYQGKYKRNG